MLEHKNFGYYITFLAAVAFIPFLGHAHLFDWDEVNFAEISREMVVLGDYLRVHVNFEPFWEKPPFFFWLQAMGMNIFGIGEFAARLPNAICGIITLAVLYNMGRKVVDRTFGALWSLAYFGSIFPHLYFKSGLIDPWFNLFIFLGIYYFILFTWKRNEEPKPPLKHSKAAYLIFAGLLIGMGILTKGPVAYLVFGICVGVYWIFRRWKLPASIPQFLLLTIIALSVTLLWYGLETLRNGPWFVEEFTKYQITLFSTHSAGHAGFPGYHFVVNLFGVFPASIIALPAFFKIRLQERHQQLFQLWMLILIWVVLILFSIVQSKIIHYSSLVYFPATFLAAVTIYEVMKGRALWRNWVTTTIAVIGGFIGIILFAVPFIGKNIGTYADRFKDPTAQDSLLADVEWHAWEGIIGLILIIGIFFSVHFIRKRYSLPQGWDLSWGAIILFLSTALTVNIAVVHLTPKVLAYSQGANVEFFEELADEDVYVHVLGYKSYIQYFYSQMPADLRPESKEAQWLLYGEIDKPAYFSVKKVNLSDYILNSPGIETLYEKNGFVFMKRNPGQ